MTVDPCHGSECRRQLLFIRHALLTQDVRPPFSHELTHERGVPNVWLPFPSYKLPVLEHGIEGFPGPRKALNCPVPFFCLAKSAAHFSVGNERRNVNGGRVAVRSLYGDRVVPCVSRSLQLWKPIPVLVASLFPVHGPLCIREVAPQEIEITSCQVVPPEQQDKRRICILPLGRSRGPVAGIIHGVHAQVVRDIAVFPHVAGQHLDERAF